MTPLAWNGTLDLDAVTVRADLDPDVAPETVERVRRFGFAIVESTAAELTAESIAVRAERLHEFGAAIGTPIVQSPRRELVEDVKDFSDVDEQTDDRGYRSSGELLPHSDPPTINILHCVRPARSGGESSLVSVAAIVERMRASDPDLVEALADTLPRWQVAGQDGRETAGPDPTGSPVLAERMGVVSCVLYRPFIEQAATALGRPLSARHVAALDLFERCSVDADLTLRFTLRAGQTLVLHNRTVLHARTDYDDHPELHRRRHLLRMWIDAPDAFPVHPAHELGDIFAGAAV